MKIQLPIILVLLLVRAAIGAAVGAEPESSKLSPSAERNAQNRTAAILAEIKGLGDHEWAGKYYAGDGLGVNQSIVIAPAAGYVFEWHGCLGLYDRNYGTARQLNDVIRLSFTFENQRKGFQGIAPEFVPVSWGARRYLIPADDFVGFCNDINQGREPRNESHGSYLMRTGDEKKPVTGFPNVPEKYRDYLLVKPIVATIIAVGPVTTRPSIAKWKFKDTPVTLDVGKDQGLQVGMELFVTDPPDMVESVRISKVEASSAEAVMTQTGEDDPGPRTGWRLSTHAPWNRPRTN